MVVSYDLLLNICLKAGSLGIALTTFLLKDNVRNLVAPFLIMLSGTSAFLFILSSVLSYVCIIIPELQLHSLCSTLYLMSAFLLLFHLTSILYSTVQKMSD